MLATGVVAVVFLLAAVVVTRVTTNYLTDQVDTQLVRFAGPATRPAVLPPSSTALPANSAPPNMRAAGNLSTLYVGVFEGSKLSTAVAPVRGSTSEAIPEIDRAAAQALVPDERVVTVGSTDESTRYRVTARLDSNDDVILLGLQLVDVDAAIQRLVTVLVIAGLVAFVALGLITWWVLRLGVRPIQRMTTAAKAVAAGDLSTRIHRAPKGTEAADLGDALNTMLERIERALAERGASEERLRQFLADASHELRTPLTSIQGFAELFRLGADQDHVDLAITMRRIEEESARMKTLVNDLLVLARLDETRPVERAPVDLAVLAADACSDAVAAEPTRPVSLDAPAPVVVEGDRDHLRQAIANLVTNALKHTPEGTPIEVSAERRNGHALVSVRDHGAGLDTEALHHAFDRFWQADHARTGTGAGLGLAIVAAIAHEHGGSVQVANPPDGGARFTIELPLNGEPPVPSPLTPPPT